MRRRAFETQRGLADGFRDRIHGREQFRLLRLLLLLRRHLALVELIENLLPHQGVVGSLDLGRERVETPVTLLLFRAVALDAILLEEILTQRRGDAEGWDEGQGCKGHAADRALIDAMQVHVSS